MRKFFRFALPALISVALFGVTVFVYILPTMEDAIMSKKKETTREVVRTVTALLETYQADVDNGRIALAEAQRRALDRVRSLRYGPEMKDYLWINDLSPRMLMHPYRSDLDGQDLNDFQDPKGKKLFVEIAREVRKPGGAGFVEYMWQHQDNPNRIIPKISYVALFEPWGWVVGSGLYYDDVQREIAKLTRDLVFVGFGTFLLVALLSSYLAWRGLTATRENQRMVESLRHSEAQFRGISSSAHDGIVMIDSDGRVTFWNEAAQKIFGYEAQEVIGQDLHKLLASADQYHQYTSAVHSFRSEGTGAAVGRTLELTALHKNGSEIPVELSVSALSFEDKWHAVGVVRDVSEKVKAAAALQESETKYRTLFDSTNDIIFLLKQEVIHDCNARAVDFFNMAKEEIVGKTPMDLSPERQENGETSEALGLGYVRLAMAGQPQHFEWTHSLPTGEPAYTDVVLKKIHLLGEEFLLAVSRDITERKKMMLEREKAASLFGAAIEQYRAGIIIADAADGKLLQANDAALKMLGETPDLLNPDRERLREAKWRILDSSGRVVPPENQPLRMAFTEGVVTANKIYIIEKGDQTRTWVEVNASPVKDRNGRIIYGMVAFTDIDERMQTEAALKRFNQFQESIIDNAIVWMTVHDSEGKVILWNKAAEEISGYERTQVIGGNEVWRWAYPNDDYRKEIMENIAGVIRTGKVIKGEETAMQCRDGSIKMIAWHVCRLGGRGEKRMEALCLGYDVTQIRNLQNQLLQTQKLEAVGTLAAGIAHDFNNILWGMLGFSELAMEQVTDQPEMARRSIERVLESGNRAKYMVQQILQFSRQSDTVMARLGIQSIVKEVVKLLRATVPSNYEIRQELSKDVGWVQADATQIHQVIMNLSTNAYHAMQPKSKGVLTLSLDMADEKEAVNCHSHSLPPGRYVRLRIADTGEGIDPENLEKIFDPYFTTKKQGEGTGLGLAVSFGIVKSHGGGIQVESFPGEGAVFTIYLPETNDGKVAEIAEIEPIQGGTERILLVDDEKILIEMTERLLTEMGYTVTSFSASTAAWEFFSEQPEAFDAVITDQAMPNMTGLELASKITALRSNIPVILCTGFSEHITPEDRAKSGIVSLLNKPLMRSELAKAVRLTLDRDERG